MMPYVAFLFFALFQLIGGVAFGAGLRQLYAAVTVFDAEARGAGLTQARGLLVTGLAFGGIVTVVSALAFARSDSRLFLIGVGLLAVAVLGSALLPRFMLQELGAGTLAAIGIGVLVVPMAVLVAIEGFRNGDPGFGLVWGGCAGFVGLTFLLGGLQALLSGKALVLAQTSPGSYQLETAAQADAAANAADAADAANAAGAATDAPDAAPTNRAHPHHHQ